MAEEADSLVNEARRLDGEARGHKGAIARHRQALQDTRARQAEVERRCAELGIAVTYHQSANGSGQRPSATGAGDHPWPQQTPSSTS